MTIHWGIHPTPFGQALLATSELGIARLAFLESDDAAGREKALLELETVWPEALLVRDQEATAVPLLSIFFSRSTSAGETASGGTRAGPGSLPLHLKGTKFQLQVWRALLDIPSGEVTTYGRLAEDLGRPGAARAVGRAVGANPLAYLIPCHRVIRANGELGSYRWGLERKRAMVAREAGGKRSRRPEGAPATPLAARSPRP